MLPLDPSDIALVADFILAISLAMIFALGRPRTWMQTSLGWVIFYYAISTVALLFLIVWSIVFGQKIDEIYRLLIAVGLGSALVWKMVAIIRERRIGRQADTDRHERNRS